MHSDRRKLLKLGLAITATSGTTGMSTASGQSVGQISTNPIGPDRHLRLANAHTWEKLDLIYWTNGVYLDASLEQIDFLMRDHRANKSRQMDLELIDYMHALYQLTGSKERMHILSGYRTPKTNAALRARSNGVAKFSLHMEGRAVDINIPGVPTKDLQEMAISLQSGGVGYYQKSGFVHIDTGTVRYWQS